jgi:hypothetical protein
MKTYAQVGPSYLACLPSKSQFYSHFSGVSSLNDLLSFHFLLSNSKHIGKDMNSTNNNSDSNKKEEFRRYLEKTGVLDALTRVLVGLYEEPDRPQNPIEYVKRYLGAPQNVDVEGLKRENQQLRQELEKLRKAGNKMGGNSNS